MTVTIAGIVQTVPMQVTVVRPAAPYYTLGALGNDPLVVGGTTRRYIYLTTYNGYSGVPSLTVGGRLPAGVSVTFDNSARLTYGTVTATLAAASTVVPASYTFAVGEKAGEGENGFGAVGEVVGDGLLLAELPGGTSGGDQGGACDVHTIPPARLGDIVELWLPRLKKR